MIKKAVKKAAAVALSCAMLVTSFTGCGSKEETVQNKGFEPRLDTNEQVSLQIAGFMGNFEALDKVINSFNELYPNVVISYEQNNQHLLRNYLDNNQSIDIFMTTEENVRNSQKDENNVNDYCVDLNSYDIDFSGVSSDILSCGTVDGRLVRIPIMKNLCGMAVNKTLLDKEGVQIPANYKEFINALEVLKQKGYTPIQSSAIHTYSELVMNMAMDMIASDEQLRNALKNGNAEAADKLLVVFERLQTIIDNGYTDYDINSTLPKDNYDGSIMNFFEGNVPFWICNTESFSGTKKRETKSETFKNNKFDYEYMYVPMGDSGSYEFIEPWYGFSVSKDSKNIDYAIEFMRFMVQEEQLNTMAAIKGMPSVAVNADDERYKSIDSASLEMSYANDGTIDSNMKNIFTDVCNAYARGEYATPKEASEAYVRLYSEAQK